MNPLVWALCLATLVAGCEDVVQAVHDHPEDMERLGKGEVQVVERKF